MRLPLIIRIPSIVLSMLLLMQHVPAGLVDGGAHQCVHCTGSYCTKGRCYCEHDHEHADQSAVPSRHEGGHARHREASAPAVPGQSWHAAAHRSSAAHDHTGAEGGVHETDRHDEAAPLTANLERDAVRTCGSNLAGIVVISLDKFSVSSYTFRLQAETERRHAPARPSFYRRVLVYDIFHPPASLS